MVRAASIGIFNQDLLDLGSFRDDTHPHTALEENVFHLAASAVETRLSSLCGQAECEKRLWNPARSLSWTCGTARASGSASRSSSVWRCGARQVPLKCRARTSTWCRARNGPAVIHFCNGRTNRHWQFPHEIHSTFWLARMTIAPLI